MDELMRELKVQKNVTSLPISVLPTLVRSVLQKWPLPECVNYCTGEEKDYDGLVDYSCLNCTELADLSDFTNT